MLIIINVRPVLTEQIVSIGTYILPYSLSIIDIVEERTKDTTIF